MLKYDISFIHKKVTELLYKYDKQYKIRSGDPSVNIWKIAQNAFGVKIRFVDPWQYDQKHAVIEFEKDIVVILLNEKDRNNEVRCRFSIAHELGHLALGHIAIPYNAAYKILKYNIAHEWVHVFYPGSNTIVKSPQIPEQQLKNMYASFIRQVGNDIQIPADELTHLFRPAPRKKSSKTPKKLNYNIAHEWGRIVYNSNYSYKLSSPGVAARHITSNPISRLFRQLFIMSWGREELADHFAANLLVPLYRFQHYLDKSDKELAEYFKVEEKCIKKRRKEFKAEMNILTAAVKPLALEEISDRGVDYKTKEPASS
jgi:Zn-dependent peptidase ImmA (M78 family)